MPDVHPGSRKGQGSGDIIADAYWIKKVSKNTKEKSVCASSIIEALLIVL